jgi:hypothetical protein
MATSVFAIGITKKSFADQKVKGGGTVADRMDKAFQSVLPQMLADIKVRYLSEHSGSSIKKRKENIYKHTKYSVTRTAKDNVSGEIRIGEGVPYTAIHVGSGGSANLLRAGNKPFVIPLTSAGIQNKDGSWRSPYVPGQLRNVPGLFRGTRKHNLNPNILYQKYKTRGIKPMFILKQGITVPTRVDINEIQDDIKSRLSVAMGRAFEGYDFGYLRMMQK